MPGISSESLAGTSSARRLATRLHLREGGRYQGGQGDRIGVKTVVIIFAGWKRLPVADTAIRIEDPLRDLLFKRVLARFVLVDFDAESRPFVRSHDTAFPLGHITFADDVRPPRDIGVDGFADDVAGLGKSEFKRGGGADRALGIVGREGDAVGLRQGGDAAGFRETAAMRDVELADLAGPLLEESPERG